MTEKSLADFIDAVYRDDQQRLREVYGVERLKTIPTLTAAQLREMEVFAEGLRRDTD